MGFVVANSQYLESFYRAEMANPNSDYVDGLAEYGLHTTLERAGSLQFFPEETATVFYWTPLPALPAVCRTTVLNAIKNVIDCECPAWKECEHMREYQRLRTFHHA